MMASEPGFTLPEIGCVYHANSRRHLQATGATDPKDPPEPGFLDRRDDRERPAHRILVQVRILPPRIGRH